MTGNQIKIFHQLLAVRIFSANAVPDRKECIMAQEMKPRMMATLKSGFYLFLPMSGYRLFLPDVEISKKLFCSILTLPPRKDVLTEFEKIAAALHARVVENLRQNQTLILVRDTLLPKLISGKLHSASRGRRLESHQSDH
jgi:hypothetical protein